MIHKLYVLGFVVGLTACSPKGNPNSVVHDKGGPVDVEVSDADQGVAIYLNGIKSDDASDTFQVKVYFEHESGERKNRDPIFEKSGLGQVQSKDVLYFMSKDVFNQLLQSYDIHSDVSAYKLRYRLYLEVERERYGLSYLRLGNERVVDYTLILGSIEDPFIQHATAGSKFKGTPFLKKNDQMKGVLASFSGVWVSSQEQLKELAFKREAPITDPYKLQ